MLDEVSQIGPRPMLKLLELQARTGMTIKMLGDREQAQAIEAGDAIEILRRALPPEALPELLTTMRQVDQARPRDRRAVPRRRGRQRRSAMKREDGHAMLVGGDRDQVVGRSPTSTSTGATSCGRAAAKRGITVSAPTNDDVAEISQAIRERLKARGEIGDDEIIYRAIDQDGRSYDLPIATGDRVRLFRRTWGTVDGRACHVGNNGDIVEVLGRNADGLRLRTKDGRVADLEWRRLCDSETGRLLLGFGHALTIDAAQGITSDEHINALPRGTSGVTAFTSYVAESRSRGTTWTIISEARRLRSRAAPAGARRHHADHPGRSLGACRRGHVPRSPTRRSASTCWRPPGATASSAVDTFIACHYALETAQLDNPNFGRDAVKRLRALAINKTLSRHLAALDRAVAENGELIRDIVREQEADAHLRALHAEAAAAKRQIDVAEGPTPSKGPGL